MNRSARRGSEPWTGSRTRSPACAGRHAGLAGEEPPSVASYVRQRSQSASDTPSGRSRTYRAESRSGTISGQSSLWTVPGVLMYGTQTNFYHIMLNLVPIRRTFGIRRSERMVVYRTRRLGRRRTTRSPVGDPRRAFARLSFGPSRTPAEAAFDRSDRAPVRRERRDRARRLPTRAGVWRGSPRGRRTGGTR